MANNTNKEIEIDMGAKDDLVEDLANKDIDEEEIKRQEDEVKKELEESDGKLFPWDLALDTYDADFPNYIPSTDALEFYNLMRLVNGADFPVQNCLGHYFMIDLVFGNVTKEMYPYSKEVQDEIHIDPEKIAMCCSRGVAKSTVITCFLPVYVAIKGELPNAGKQYFWCLLGASARGHGRVMAKGIAGFCEESKFLKDYMEDMHFTETEAWFIRKGTQPLKQRTFTIKFGSAYSPIRGIKDAYSNRPCAALLDDVIPTSAAAYSPVIMDTLETALYADIENALKSNGGIMINVFTPFWVGDPCTKSILNKAFTPLLLPLAERLDDEQLELKDIKSTWPQEHPEKRIYKRWNTAKKANMMKTFQQERQLQLVSGQDRLVPDRCIQYCDMTPIIQNIHMYNIYITTDYTTTSGEKSDFSGRATWALSNNGDVFMLDLALRKMNMGEQYAGTLNEAANWKRRMKHVEIGVELDGGQTAHVYSLEQEMRKRGDYYSFAKDRNNPQSDRKGILSRSTGVKKHERFRIASQIFLQNKLWLPEHLKDTPDMKEFVLQVKGATHEQFTRSDDGPDLVTMLQVSMVTVLPSEGVAIDTSLATSNGGVFNILDVPIVEATRPRSTVF